jgi:hypothetical protein
METSAMLALCKARYLECTSSCHLVAQPVGSGTLLVMPTCVLEPLSRDHLKSTRVPDDRIGGTRVSDQEHLSLLGPHRWRKLAVRRLHPHGQRAKNKRR